MPPPRRVAVALAALLLLGGMGRAAFVLHLSSVRDGFYRIHEEGVLLQMPECLWPCAFCEATFDLSDRSVAFGGERCRVARVLRLMRPVVGRYDIEATSLGRDFYGTRVGGWLLETRGCAVEAAAMPTRVVIDRADDRMLLEAPDHPDASVTGRVTCPILRVYGEVLF